MILVPIKHLSSENYQGFSRQQGCIIPIFQRHRRRWIDLPKVTQSITDGFQNTKLSYFSSVRPMTVIKPFFASSPSPLTSSITPMSRSPEGTSSPVLFVFLVLFRLQDLLAQECGLKGTEGQSKCMGQIVLFYIRTWHFSVLWHWEVNTLW